VTNRIKEIVSGSSANYGFMIRVNSPKADTAKDDYLWGGLWRSWYSSDASEVNKRPKLIIEYDDVTSINGTLNKSLDDKVKVVGREIHFATTNTRDIAIYSLKGVELFHTVSCNSTIEVPASIGQGRYIIQSKSNNGVTSLVTNFIK
jgi:hypothetical protein